MPFTKNIRKRFWKKISLALGSPIPCPSVMFNLDNGFQFSVEFSISIDWDAWLKIARMKGRFVYVPSKLLKHRIHAESAITAGLKANCDRLRIWKCSNDFGQIFLRGYL